METDFYRPLQFESLSPVVSPVMTSLFELEKLPSPGWLVMGEG